MMRKVNIECDALSSPIAASPININARKALVIMANLIKKKKQRGIKDKGVFVSGKWDLNTILYYQSIVELQRVSIRLFNFKVHIPT